MLSTSPVSVNYRLRRTNSNKYKTDMNVMVNFKPGKYPYINDFIQSDTTQVLATSNFIGPWYHSALLFSGLGSIVLLFVLLFLSKSENTL